MIDSQQLVAAVVLVVLALQATRAQFPLVQNPRSPIVPPFNGEKPLYVVYRQQQSQTPAPSLQPTSASLPQPVPPVRPRQPERGNEVAAQQQLQQQQQQQQQYQQQQQQQQQQQAPPLPPNGAQGRPQFQYDEASFAVTDLARRIGTVLGQQTNAGVFSPVSIACALSLLLLAASGETRKELIEVLNFNPSRAQFVAIHQQYGRMLRELAVTTPDTYPITWRQTDRCSDEDDEEEKPDPQLIHLANAIFIRRDFSLNPKFIDASWIFYNSSINKLDFASQPQQSAYSINRWASENTYGKINQIVPDYLDVETQMVVANALYFKGLWTEMFEKHATALKKFYPDGYANPSTAKDILTMAVIGCFPYYDAVEYDAKIIGLPYQGEKTAMYIIVPNNSTRAKLQRFQSTLTGKDIGDMVVRMTVKKTLVQLPKMKISNTINLRDVLQRLNLRTIFHPSSSDLSGMLDPEAGGSSRQRLYASDIVHKVELEINEKGTEGGAVTASTIFRSLPSVQMRIDTPFLMLLGHDATRLPLFYGSIYDPSG